MTHPDHASFQQKDQARFLQPSAAVGTRFGTSVAVLEQSFLDNLFCALGRVPMAATRHDLYAALSLTIRDRLLNESVRTMENYAERDARVVAYLFAEFLPGPHLANNLLNLGIVEPTRQALAELDINLDEVLEQEEEPGLGNGGLGRLASCYLDSLATVEVPAVGYGIRYEFGIFDRTPSRPIHEPPSGGPVAANLENQFPTSNNDRARGGRR